MTKSKLSLKVKKKKGKILMIYPISVDMKQNIVCMFDKIRYDTIVTKLMNNLNLERLCMQSINLPVQINNNKSLIL